MTPESLSVLNPNPNARSCPMLIMNKTAFLHSCPFPSLRFGPQLRPRCLRLSVALNSFSVKAHGFRFISSDGRRSWSHSVVSFAASHEDSKHSEIEVEKETDSLNSEVEESQEAWKRTLASFKEQALKMKGISEEAYEVYSKKALIILKETSEQLKIQADKASHDLSVIAKEISEEGREFLSTAAENSPEEVREIVETFTSSTDDLREISRVQDFYLGVPYGLALSLGGFLSFMLTGSTAAIRFGVILGGALLTLSISSLRSYKRGKSSPIALTGQAAISAIIFTREIRLLSQRSSLVSYLTTFISGLMVAFYIYRIMRDGRWEKESNLKRDTDN